jgi:hypothetical protein
LSRVSTALPTETGSPWLLRILRSDAAYEVTFYCQGFRLHYWLKQEAFDYFATTNWFRREPPPSLRVSNCNMYFLNGVSGDSGLAFRHGLVWGCPIIIVRTEVTAQQPCARQSSIPCQQRSSCLFSCVAYS